MGVGHLMRCLALAEELTARGQRVCFAGDVQAPAWAAHEVARLGATAVPAPADPASMAGLLERLSASAVVIDSYEVDPGVSRQARRHGWPVVVISDGDTREQDADIVVDQNLDAERNPAYREVAGRLMLGLRYVLLRDSVRRQRPSEPRSFEAGQPFRLLAFFGGTDAAAAATTVVPLALATGIPFELTVVARDPGTAGRLAELGSRPGQTVHVIAPTPMIGSVAARSDLVLSASGTSTWELLCLGVPAALVWVVDNQRLGYEGTTGHGLAVGLGGVAELREDAAARDSAVAALRQLIGAPRRLSELSQRGWDAVDGRGRERVVDAIESQLTEHRG